MRSHSISLFVILQVNVGCVPKKVMFNTAMHAEMIHDHKDYGFDVELKKFDWRSVLQSEIYSYRKLHELASAQY